MKIPIARLVLEQRLVVADVDALHKAVNEVRAARKALAGRPSAAALDGQLRKVEEALMQVNMKGSEANLAFPGMLNEQYATFAASMDDADTPPTARSEGAHLEPPHSTPRWARSNHHEFSGTGAAGDGARHCRASRSRSQTRSRIARRIGMRRAPDRIPATRGK